MLMAAAIPLFQGEILSRRDNRQALRRLFQGYVADFGPEPGGQIIKTVVDILGGQRISVPGDGKRCGRRYHTQSYLAIMELWQECTFRFSAASGMAIMRKFIVELRGLRISFPDQADIYREERDNKIRLAYNGANKKELALTWGLTVSQVVNILRQEA